MPIVERTMMHDTSKSVPLQILNRGPEYFRQQALRNQHRQPSRKTATERLAETRSQYLKRDSPSPPPPAEILNGNSNNRAHDNRPAGDIADNRCTVGRVDASEDNNVPCQEKNCRVAKEEDDVPSQDKILDLFGKRESGRGRERKRDSRRGRRRAKVVERNGNCNSERSCTDEKAAIDVPERGEVIKHTKPFLEPDIRMTKCGNQEAERMACDTSVDLQKTSRTSVKDIVSKISARSGDTPGASPCEKAPRKLYGGSGRQRSSRTMPHVSSESSETSPTLPRKAFSSHLSRAPRSRGRERTKPSIPSKPQNKVSYKKSPQGSRIQNILNAFHQQTGSDSSTKDKRTSPKASSVHSRGKSCPPTNRSQPSLADLLARDAEGARPRSKDLNDLDQLISTESDDVSVVDVKARIKSFQLGSLREPLERTTSEKISHTCKSSSRNVVLLTGNRNHSEKRGKTSVTFTHSPQFVKIGSEVTSVPRAKQTDISNVGDANVDFGELYALPDKCKVSGGDGVVGGRVDGTHSPNADESDKASIYIFPQDLCIENNTLSEKSSVLSKEVFQTESEDTGFGEQWETSRNQNETNQSAKPLVPKKPDISVIDKYNRYSYHVYEAVTDLLEDCPSDTPFEDEENSFNTPHVSDAEPEESFEIVTEVSAPLQQTEACRTRSMPLMAMKEGPKEKNDPVVRQGSVLSSITSHMKKLKGILMGDKEQQREDQSHASKQNTNSGPNEALIKNGVKENKFKSPTQRKLAAQLDLEPRDDNCDVQPESFSDNKGSNTALEGQDSIEERGNASEGAKVMKPVHSKSFSLDDLKRSKLKTSLSADNPTFPQAKDDENAAKETSTGKQFGSRSYFPMPHDEQKHKLSKKLEKFLLQSKAHDSAGDSPTKESCDSSSRLKKKVSFDDTTVLMTETHGKTVDTSCSEVRKVSITPLTENYDVVEYNTDTKEDLVEETIVIDSSNAIRLASPRPSQTSLTDTPKVALKKQIPKISQESTEGSGTTGNNLCSNHEERPNIHFPESTVSNAEVRESTVPFLKNSSKEDSADSVPKCTDNVINTGPSDPDIVEPNARKLTNFREASVSTDLDTSPTHDFHGTTHNSHLDHIKQQSGTCTSSSGNAKVRGEYDTSSRSDDCGMGATKGKVKHLKPFNARPFRNKNFSSDEDVIPEVQSRKSFWQTKAQLDLPSGQHRTRETSQASRHDIGDALVPSSQNATRDTHHLHLGKQQSDQESSVEGNGFNEVRCGMRRSKSEPSNATCVQELDQFFDRMGLDDSILEVASKPHIYDEEEVFHDMHVWRTRGHQGSESDDSNTSYARSETSNVSEDGVMNLRKFTKQLPDQSMSIVTKNARVIKWMYQCKKSLEQAQAPP